MTFLQYVCERLLGPPARRTGTDGESYWCCPFHDDSTPSFHTLPHRAEYRDRWRCFGCGMRGDEADLMQHFYPGEDWPRRRVRLDQWRQDYEREVVVARAAVAAPAAGIYFRGNGEAGKRGGERRDHPLEVAAAFADLTESERKTLIAAREVMQGERVKTVSFEALAQYCFDFVEWMRRPEGPSQAWSAEATELKHQRNGRS